MCSGRGGRSPPRPCFNSAPASSPRRCGRFGCRHQWRRRASIRPRRRRRGDVAADDGPGDDLDGFNSAPASSPRRCVQAALPAGVQGRASIRPRRRRRGDVTAEPSRPKPARSLQFGPGVVAEEMYPYQQQGIKLIWGFNSAPASSPRRCDAIPHPDLTWRNQLQFGPGVVAEEMCAGCSRRSRCRLRFNSAPASSPRRCRVPVDVRHGHPGASIRPRRRRRGDVRSGSSPPRTTASRFNSAPASSPRRCPPASATKLTRCRASIRPRRRRRGDVPPSGWKRTGTCGLQFGPGVVAEEMYHRPPRVQVRHHRFNSAPASSPRRCRSRYKLCVRKGSARTPRASGAGHVPTSLTRNLPLTYSLTRSGDAARERCCQQHSVATPTMPKILQLDSTGPAIHHSTARCELPEQSRSRSATRLPDQDTSVAKNGRCLVRYDGHVGWGRVSKRRQSRCEPIGSAATCLSPGGPLRTPRTRGSGPPPRRSAPARAPATLLGRGTPGRPSGCRAG